MTPELWLFDDAVARSWQPFALTRPAAELLLGALTFRERTERVLALRCAGTVTTPHLRGFEEPGAARAADAGEIDAAQPRVLLASRVVLDAAPAPAWRNEPLTLTVAGAPVGAYLPPGAPTPAAEWFLEPQPLPDARVHDLPGRLLPRVWDLIAQNPAQIARDIELVGPAAWQGDPARAPFSALVMGDGALRVGTGVSIEPNVVLDFSAGPIWLDDDVTVRAFTRLAGPAYVGRGSTLLGGPFTAVSIGPVCKVHGEMEETVVLGYSNKAHDGFLGHAYLGRWVNLGAMTTNSDLKNNYGSIRMWTPDGEVDTGLQKLGCLLGDHVKTGIGALLNTGTVIGAGTNVFGTAMPPKYVPPFSWGSGSELVAFDVEKFLALAATVMGRRNLELSAGMGAMLRAAWHEGRRGA